MSPSVVRFFAVAAIVILLVPTVTAQETVEESETVTILDIPSLGEAVVYAFNGTVLEYQYGPKTPDAWLLVMDVPSTEETLTLVFPGGSQTSDVLEVIGTERDGTFEATFPHVPVFLLPEGSYGMEGSSGQSYGMPAPRPAMDDVRGGGHCPVPKDLVCDQIPWEIDRAPFPVEPVTGAPVPLPGQLPGLFSATQESDVYCHQKNSVRQDGSDDIVRGRVDVKINKPEGSMLNGLRERHTKTYEGTTKVGEDRNAWSLTWSVFGRNEFTGSNTHFRMAVAANSTEGTDMWRCSNGKWEHARYIAEKPELGIWRHGYDEDTGRSSNYVFNENDIQELGGSALDEGTEAALQFLLDSTCDYAAAKHAEAVFACNMLDLIEKSDYRKRTPYDKDDPVKDLVYYKKSAYAGSVSFAANFRETFTTGTGKATPITFYAGMNGEAQFIRGNTITSVRALRFEDQRALEIKRVG